jgi:threonine dehydratase/serine racemase
VPAERDLRSGRRAVSGAAPTLDDIRAAARRIAPHVHRTPVVTSATLDRELEARVFFKCENLQKVGAFKARGAATAVLALDEAAARAGVVTHSSGNHAAALAWAAGIRGIPCTIVMPEDAPRIKVDAVRGYGGRIVFCRREEREATCGRVLAERGGTLIHPFEYPPIIAGQGTAALELIEETGPLDAVIAPVGGGGLLSGTAIAVKGLLPRAVVLGAEPEAVDDAFRSLSEGRLYPAPPHPRTVADGLMTGLGRINFEILTACGARIVTVSEQAILEAARFVVERMKLVVEPSGATVVAALRRVAGEIRGRRVGAILSGGNTDLAWIGRA